MAAREGLTLRCLSGDSRSEDVCRRLQQRQFCSKIRHKSIWCTVQRWSSRAVVFESRMKRVVLAEKDLFHLYSWYSR